MEQNNSLYEQIKANYTQSLIILNELKEESRSSPPIQNEER